LYVRLKTDLRCKVVFCLCAGVLMGSTDALAQALQNAGEKRRIIVYTTNGCQKCNMLKEWLKTSNRYFEERNLEDVDVMTELVMRNVVVLSAPVIEVDDSIYAETQFFDGNTLAVSKLQEILEGNNSG